MKDRIMLQNRLCRINPEVSPEDVIVAFPFDLAPEGDVKTDGFVAVTTSDVYVYENDVLMLRLKSADIDEYIFSNGVGCVFAECVTNGVHRLLCRATMAQRDLISSIIWQLNRRMERGTYSYAYEEETDVKCPTCGRRYPPDSHA